MTDTPNMNLPDFDLEGELDVAGDDESEFDCHMGQDGQCGAAGSEMCDFECPTMAALRRRWRREDATHGK